MQAMMRGVSILSRQAAPILPKRVQQLRSPVAPRASSNDNNEACSTSGDVSVRWMCSALAGDTCCLTHSRTFAVVCYRVPLASRRSPARRAMRTRWDFGDGRQRFKPPQIASMPALISPCAGVVRPAPCRAPCPDDLHRSSHPVHSWERKRSH